MRHFNITTRKNTVQKSLCASVSALAMLLSVAMPAHAQDSDDDDEIIATGIRQSLKSAQDLKANADTFVDAITAEDIGALPDRSVSEALQRVPGVSIIRFSGPNDPDHFDVEGSGVVVRGLPFIRSELNGRDVFAANAGGVLSFADVSPELLGSVVVFKNQSADLIEGGLAGSIDLRTRLPFDNGGKRVIAGSIEGTYSDFSEEFNPSGSALLSNSWDTKSGRFGFLINGSYNELNSRADAIQVAAFEPIVVTDFFDGGGFNTDGIDANNPNLRFVPGGGGFRTQEFDRERQAIAAAAQWESTDQTILATAQFLHSDASTVWGENVVESVVDARRGQRVNLDASDFVFDENNVFQSGTIIDDGVWNGGPRNAGLLPGAPGENDFGTASGQQNAISRQRLEENVTTDFGFNVKYAPKDNLRFNFDAQYIDSTSDVVDLQFGSSFISSLFIDVSDTSNPQVSLVPVDPPSDTGENIFADPSNFFIRNFLDHVTENEADALAFRGDVEYDFSDDGWLKSVRAGVRYSDQDTTLRESDFNWGNVSELWTGTDVQQTADSDATILLLGGNPNPELDTLVSSLFANNSFDNFFRRGAGFAGIPDGLATDFVGPGVNNFQEYQDLVASILARAGSFSNVACGGPAAPLTLRSCTNGDSLIAGTPFLQSEVGSLSRDTFAAYGRLDFGWDGILGGDDISLTGNIGVRYVNTDRTIDSVQIVPNFNALTNNVIRDDGMGNVINDCDDANRLARSNAIGGAPIETPGVCVLDLDALQSAFGNGSFEVVPVDISYDEWLPSLNLKLDLGNGHNVRFAASRTLSRPSTDQILQRPQISIGNGSPTGQLNNTGGDILSFGGFQGTQTGNARLLPQLSTNLDLSWEWYFDDAGSLTFTTFYKQIDDFINISGQALPLPEGSALGSQDLSFNTFVNENEEADLRGIEISYQQFYDFLPGLLSGFGSQFTYTYIDSEGVVPTLDESLDIDQEATLLPRFNIDRGAFPRISEHTLNLVGLYEKGPVQARVAYNWRSEFQVTQRDVIDPFATIFQPATGQLDASLFYDLTENIKIGVQGVNLLDDVTETTQSIDNTGRRAPRSFFRNDRRFSAILRASF